MNLWESALSGLSENCIKEHAEGLLAAEENNKSEPAKKRPSWLPAAITAAAMLLIAAGSLWGPQLFGGRGAVVVCTTAAIPAASSMENLVLEKKYVTRITSEEYTHYRAARVCEADYVGEALGRVTVEGHWETPAGDPVDMASAQLGAQLFSLKGIDPSVAVCLRFEGEFNDPDTLPLTNDHYYVYIKEPWSAAVLDPLYEKLGWRTAPDPGPSEGGTVTGYTMGAVPTTGPEIVPEDVPGGAEASQPFIPVEAWQSSFRSVIDREGFRHYRPYNYQTCEEKYVGESLGEVQILSDWGYSSEPHHLVQFISRGELFCLKDIPAETAVCLRFHLTGPLGEEMPALSGEQYYVFFKEPWSGQTIDQIKEMLGWSREE